MSMITQVPADPMGKQEIYDNVYAYFSRPRAKLAFDINQGECLYRVYDENEHVTRCCGFGCLIPDDLYTEDMEGRPWENVIDENELLTGLIDTESESVKAFMTEVQSLHDSVASENLEDTATFLAYLDVLALAHSVRRQTARPKLTTPPLLSYVEPHKFEITLLQRERLPAHVERHIKYIAERAEQAAFKVICDGLVDCTGFPVTGDIDPLTTLVLDELFVGFVKTMAVNSEALSKDDVE